MKPSRPSLWLRLAAFFKNTSILWLCDYEGNVSYTLEEARYVDGIRYAYIIWYFRIGWITLHPNGTVTRDGRPASITAWRPAVALAKQDSHRDCATGYG